MGDHDECCTDNKRALTDCSFPMTQEDAHILALDFDAHTSLFSVFDGHGGKAVALFAAKHLVRGGLLLKMGDC